MMNMINVCADFAYGMVEVHPEILNATYGKPAEINCTATSEHDVEWEFMREGASSKLTICTESVVPDEVANEYTCNKVGRTHTLTIANVGFDDAGKYTCIESGGRSTNSSSARLVVSSKCDLCSIT